MGKTERRKAERAERLRRPATTERLNAERLKDPSVRKRHEDRWGDGVEQQRRDEVDKARFGGIGRRGRVLDLLKPPPRLLVAQSGSE